MKNAFCPPLTGIRVLFCADTERMLSMYRVSKSCRFFYLRLIGIASDSILRRHPCRIATVTAIAPAMEALFLSFIFSKSSIYSLEALELYDILIYMI